MSVEKLRKGCIIAVDKIRIPESVEGG